MTIAVRCGMALLGGMLLAAPLSAKPHELRVPLHDGKLQWADLTADAIARMHLPRWHPAGGSVDLRGIRGSLFVASLNAALGEGCRVELLDDELIVHVDTEKLPQSVDDAKLALRTFVATDNPDATAAEEKHLGLFLPETVDASRHLVVLIHGMGCGVFSLSDMGQALKAQGYQVAYFCYRGDAPVRESVKELERHLDALRDTFPGIRLNFVAHSMGGLIARAYVESDDYRGDVDHLILVGTPNYGSNWTKFHLALKVQSDFEQAMHDPDWHWSWIVTEGLGESAGDLTPRSKFLTHLNSRPRRAGVAYTIIAGDHSAVASAEADWAKTGARWIPNETRNWWAIGSLRQTLERQSDRLREQVGDSDGPVRLASARLEGVKDVVIVPSDHRGLFCGTLKHPPAALPAVLARLTP